VLGAIAARTGTLGLATGVTCPSMRYHPAIVAQAAATLAIVSDNRFTLGIGAGSGSTSTSSARASERPRPARAAGRGARHHQPPLAGGYQSYQGKYLQLEDARVFDLPDRLPVIAVAAGGRDAARLAATHGTGCSPPSRAAI